MWYGRGFLLHLLIEHKIVRKNLTLKNRFEHSLFKFYPHLIPLINEATIFLKYSANLKTRIHCIIQNIREQPLCKMCKAPVEMRLSGKQRYTFPTYCSSSCISKDEITKNKKRETNKQKYGVTNVLSRRYVHHQD